MEEGSFLYDSDAYDDKLPYWVKPAGKPHLVVPYSLTNNDWKFLRGSIGTVEQFFAFLRDGFDMLYDEGRTQPKMMSVGMHMHLLGDPTPAAVLQRFLDYVAQKTDVWITRRIEIARHWIATHPSA